MKLLRKSAAALLLGCIGIALCGTWATSYAQITEPDVRTSKLPKTPVDEGFTNRIGGGLFVNNFGIGIDGVFSHAISPYTELFITTGITGIRDVSEQNFTDYFTGQRTVPNKYNRALGVPLMVGVKKRIFPRQIADNFRFFFAASGGPAMALVYPYINDSDDNGYRTSRIIQTVYGYQSVYTERKRGFFGGLGDAHTKLGAAGAIKVGVDLGKNFKRQSTLEIGYFFYYFSDGLQLMDPYKPEGYDDQGYSYGQEPFFDSQEFFGTPQIKFTFSGWW